MHIAPSLHSQRWGRSWHCHGCKLVFVIGRVVVGVVHDLLLWGLSHIHLHRRNITTQFNTFTSN